MLNLCLFVVALKTMTYISTINVKLAGERINFFLTQCKNSIDVFLIYFIRLQAYKVTFKTFSEIVFTSQLTLRACATDDMSMVNYPLQNLTLISVILSVDAAVKQLNLIKSRISYEGAVSLID